MRRAFVVVLDACGAGAAPDAAEYRDAAADTLGHLAHAAGGLDLPVLASLGLGSILPLAGVARALGYPAGAQGEFLDDFRRVTRRARLVVEKVFYQ